MNKLRECEEMRKFIEFMGQKFSSRQDCEKAMKCVSLANENCNKRIEAMGELETQQTPHAAGGELREQTSTLAIYTQLTRLAHERGQVVGKKGDYYVTLEQVESVLNAKV